MDKTEIPRHPRMGDYLVAHYGIFAEDDSDGLGPGWTSWDPAVHGSRGEVEAAVTAWAASYVSPEQVAQQAAQAAQAARAAKLAALETAKDSLDKASTVAGVKSAAAAAIAALEARLAALEGR